MNIEDREKPAYILTKEAQFYFNSLLYLFGNIFYNFNEVTGHISLYVCAVRARMCCVIFQYYS